MTPDGRGGRYVDQYYQDPSGWWWPLGSQTYQDSVWWYLITFNLLEAWIRAIAPKDSWPRWPTEFGGTLEHSNKCRTCVF